MGQAKCRRDRHRFLLRVEERLEAAIAIRLQDAGEATRCTGSARMRASDSTSSRPISDSWSCFGEATVAQVLVAKYADHLPLYRQAQIYARQGLDLDRSTLADWAGRAAFLLRPVRERLLARMKQSPKLFADETTAPVLDPGRGCTKTGQLWAYARDDRPWGGSDPPAVAYVYAPDRKAERPITYLAGFAGILQVDGYAGYRALAERGDVQMAFCWSHVRQRFYELAAAGPAPIASEALERIAGLLPSEPISAAAPPTSVALSATRRADQSSTSSTPGCASTSA